MEKYVQISLFEIGKSGGRGDLKEIMNVVIIHVENELKYIPTTTPLDLCHFILYPWL